MSVLLFSMLYSVGAIAIFAYLDAVDTNFWPACAAGVTWPITMFFVLARFSTWRVAAKRKQK